MQSKLTTFLFFITFAIQLIIPNSYAYDQRFIIKHSQDNISFNIDLDEGYKIYWLYSGDLGQPTMIDLNNSQNLKIYKIVWPFPEKGKVLRDLESYFYTGSLSIPLYVNAIDESVPVELKAYLSYLLCKDLCVPITQEIESSLYVKNREFTLKSFSVKDLIYRDTHLEFITHFTEKVETPDFIIATNKISNNFKVQQINDTDFKVIIENLKNQELEGKSFDIYSDKTDIPAKLVITNIEWSNLFIILVFALIGGFILNFMPCVLPVLSLKLLSITNKRLSNTSLYLSISGVIVSFLSLAFITIILKNSGQQFGLGINFQHPEFIIFLSVIITIFISSALDRLNLNLSSSFRNFLSNYRFHNHYLEDFFSGVLATILSTPCTAPFLGVAISFALTSNNLMIILVFFVIGLGFCIPYFVLIACPKLISYMPKSGIWMLTLKKILVSFLVFTLIWLLSILYIQIGLRPVVGLFLILLLLKFILEQSLKQLYCGFVIKILAIVTIVFCSFYLPHFAHKQNIEHDLKIDKLWQKFDSSKIKEYVNEGKIVVVDITADWCITCKFNKLMVWDQNRTIKLLNQKNIIAMRADYTKLDPEIYNYLRSNGEFGIPFNKIYAKKSENGIMMPVILSFSDVQKAIRKLSE